MTRTLAIGLATVLAISLVPAGPAAIAKSGVVKECYGGKCSKKYYHPRHNSNNARKPKGLKAR